jgi:hypothetical protein
MCTQSQQSTPTTLTPCLLAEYIVLRLFDESLTHIALLIRTPEKALILLCKQQIPATAF